MEVGGGRRVYYTLPPDKKIAVVRRIGTRFSDLRYQVWPPKSLDEMTEFSAADLTIDGWFGAYLTREQVDEINDDFVGGQTPISELEGIQIGG